MNNTLRTQTTRVLRTTAASARRSLQTKPPRGSLAPVLSTTTLLSPQSNASVVLPSTTAGASAPYRFNSTQVGEISRDSRRSTEQFTAGLQTILALLSERGSFNYAEAWVPHEGMGQVQCKATWADDSFDAVESFREAAYSINLPKGKGEVGRVWEAGAPSFLEELKFKGRARINGAEGAGLKSGLVVPVLSGDEVMAVLHFYSTKTVVPALGADAMMNDFTRHGSMLMAAHLDSAQRPMINTSAVPAGSENVVNQKMMDDCYQRVVEFGAFERSTVYEDVDWFFNHLGLPRTYFERFGAREIARHVAAYISAKKLASVVDERTGDDMRNEIETTVQSPNSLVIMRPATREAITEVDALIDDMRNRCRTEHRCLTTARFRTTNTAVPYGNCELMVWILDNEEYVNPDAAENERDAMQLTSLKHQKNSQRIFPQFQEAVNRKQDRLSPLIERGEAMPDGTIPIIIGLRSTVDKANSKHARGFNQLIAELLGEDLIARRRYATTTSNGLVFHNLYLDAGPSEERIEEFMDDIRLISLTPKSNIEQQLLNRSNTASEYCYSVCAANFIYYFMKDQNEDLRLLREALDDDPLNDQRLERLALTMHQEAVTPVRIEETLIKYPAIVKQLYQDFQQVFDPEGPRNDRRFNEELAAEIDRNVLDEYDREFLKTALVMNESLLKTNFYKDRKSSISFRFDPTFLENNDRYSEKPFGVFMLLGSDFRGFHVRFRDVARGGIRLIPSRDQATYSQNRKMVFAENYGLAHTQNAKNKDIPEFGSKGTILLEPNCQENGASAFYKYISGVFDLLLPNEKEIVDHYGSDEILFLGPDEGTADVMQWACDYAKERGYPYWKSITTGKPPALGGIPHDTYGMTTLSVHEYAKGTLAKLGLEQSDVTKLQTGGPDGDLGSNEILISHDNTTSIVDGSGVIHDPAGLNRDELTRLATERVMIEAFDQTLLSPDGFRVLVNDNDVTLPNGDNVPNGATFRNNFHTNPLGKADLFVPCGGRPESINAGNVDQLFDEEGVCHFKYLIEGANLFVTADARATLEDAGVVLFKDASTNKGGVTSSSMEVLAALSLTDEEFDVHMRVPTNLPEDAPQFYKDYVQEITEIVKDNAKQEFEVLWKEHEESGTPRHRLTDILSARINELNVAVQSSTLWEDKAIRRQVLSKAFPQKLQELVGLDELMVRLPEPYQNAVFGYYIASRYVYKYGLSGREFAFFEFMSNFSNEEL